MRKSTKKGKTDMEKQESKELAAIAYRALDEKKAENIEVIEIDQISPLADYFVIASGTNLSQTEAMVEAVEEKAALAGFEPDHVEGHRNANWTLIDFQGVVVHVFDQEAREFYDLDRIWKDGRKVTIEELEA